MDNTALKLFDSLKSYSYLEELINNAESENLYLECKAPQDPKISSGIRSELEIMLSGFSNTEGGVIIWGVSVTPHSHSGLDVLTQLEPIANCRSFARQIENIIPRLTSPSLLVCKTKVLIKRKRDTRGVILTYVPKHEGDPIQTTTEHRFYFRNGDSFSDLSHQMLKRLFEVREAPDLQPLFENKLVEINEDGSWKIPIILENLSRNVAENVTVSVTVMNPSACQNIEVENFRDVSRINIGKKMFMNTVDDVIHKELNLLVGTLNITMLKEKRTKRKLVLRVAIHARSMNARESIISIHLSKRGFSVISTQQKFLY